jgi:signal transduction histidine kinase
MENGNPDSKKVFQTAAWMWLLYLVLQTFMDLAIYAGRLGGPVLQYYMINFIPALVFLGFSYTNLLKSQSKITTALMILEISIVPILTNHLFGLRLPEAPLSNIEGMVLRQLPVLMIALVLVAWHYPKGILVIYTLILSICELAFAILFRQMADPRSMAFIFTIIIRTVCFLVVGIFVNQLITSLRAQQGSLKIANQKLAHYASTLENLTITRERNRLSRELHDTVVHTLSGLSVQLETAKAYLDIDQKTSKNLLEKSLESIRYGLQEIRRALKSLRASPLDDLGLVKSLQQLSKSAGERSQLSVDTVIPQEELMLSPDIEQCIYRVAQEAVENVLHHANARHLVVKLAANGADIELVVRDDGAGFEPKSSSPNGHFGITGMMERAQMVDGELTISSKPEAGTTVRLVIKGCIQ